jgi:hypothetical protein
MSSNKRGKYSGANSVGKAKTTSMKTEMLKYFGSITVVSFLSLLTALILTVVLTNEKIKSDSSNALENQIEDQAHATLQESGDYVTQFLNMYEESVVTMVSKSATDTFRSDYCLSLSEPSYFEYGNTYLATPLTQDSRQIKPVSMSHSSYYITGSTPADLANGFDATLDDLRNRTTHLDTLFRHVYTTNQDLVALYTGFHAGSSPSFFRHYPGSESLSTDPTRSYDPQLRPWYSAAESASPEAAFTAPYYDSFGKGWMITGSRVIQDESGGVLGWRPLGCSPALPQPPGRSPLQCQPHPAAATEKNRPRLEQRRPAGPPLTPHNSTHRPAPQTPQLVWNRKCQKGF